MKRGIWKSMGLVAAVALAVTSLAWRGSMAEIKVFQPEPLGGMKEVSASADSKKLDAEAVEYFRGQFSIASARYYLTPSEIPWIAVSKSVQNQMEEKSIRRLVFDWYEPGIDFVDVYPQDNNKAAVAVVMARGTALNADRLVGYYVLSGRAAAR